MDEDAERSGWLLIAARLSLRARMLTCRGGGRPGGRGYSDWMSVESKLTDIWEEETAVCLTR